MFDLGGALTLVNLLWAVSIFAILVALSSLFVLYVLPALQHVPLTLLELGGYASAAALVAAAYYWLLVPRPIAAVFVAATGCAAVVPLYFFTLALHFADREAAPGRAFQTLFILCAHLWAGVALAFDSTLIGFAAVGALFGALGFTAATAPFVYAIGFESTDAIPRCMGAAGYLIAVYVAAALNGYDSHRYWQVFRHGVLGFGAFVHFLGWLIVTNRYYSNGYSIGATIEGTLGAPYVWRNVAAFACCGAAVVFGGAVPTMHVLQSVGGTFLGLMVLNKYTELPWDRHTWAWYLLGGGLLLWALGYVAHAFPHYVVGAATTAAT